MTNLVRGWKYKRQRNNGTSGMSHDTEDFRLSQTHDGRTCNSAPAWHRRLCFRFQDNSVIRWLAKHQWLVALQLMSQCHKYSFYVVIIIGVFSRGLKQRHTVCVSKLLCQVCGHLNGTSQVTFISNQDARYVTCQQVLLAFLNPRWQAVEAGHVGHVIDKDDSVHVPVVVLNHALPEPLLSCSVPQLDLDALAVDLHRSLSEVHPDGGLGAVGEAAGAEAVSQARLAHVRVADHDDLEDTGSGGR